MAVLEWTRYDVVIILSLWGPPTMLLAEPRSRAVTSLKELAKNCSHRYKGSWVGHGSWVGPELIPDFWKVMISLAVSQRSQKMEREGPLLGQI